MRSYRDKIMPLRLQEICSFAASLSGHRQTGKRDVIVAVLQQPSENASNK
jgi:hypothetical protein